MSVLGAGSSVPDFSLATEDGGTFTNADLQKGRTSVLVFYPFAFSPVCTDQLQLYEEVREELAAGGTDLYAVSCDARFSQTAFRDHLGVAIPQLSDFEPKASVCEAFGVKHPGGFSQRALVIVGPDGVVRWSHETPSPADLPGVDVLLQGVAAAQA
ncbi:MAG TPA: redoxin domain-containing protein [Solirubrobacteraceae bacterium]|jgi:peroxiredoxin (alkyl hydroperoxide reductase subunit C)|nr:redoxin domain-containing protein [Solirubrobacteraceae bacterium]